MKTKTNICCLSSHTGTEEQDWMRGRNKMMRNRDDLSDAQEGPYRDTDCLTTMQGVKVIRTGTDLGRIHSTYLDGIKGSCCLNAQSNSLKVKGQPKTKSHQTSLE